MKKLCVLLVMLLTLVSCSLDNQGDVDPIDSNVDTVDEIAENPEDDTEKIKAEIATIFETKLMTLKNKDLDQYLTTITQSDNYYLNEQKRWFTEMTKEGMNNINFEVLDIELLDENRLIANVRQTHFYNASFDITYPLLFLKEKDKWLDAGYNYEIYQTERYTIKYMKGETKVEAFDEIIAEAYDNLAAIFEEKPDKNFEFKLYHDREMLRQRTIPSIAWLFTGWGEANESLKLYTGHESLDGYRGTIQHELVHHITMRICNNNLPGWLADGIALQYGNMILEGGNAITLGHTTKEQVSGTIEYLENTELWDSTDQGEIWDWYNTTQMYTEYIIDTYGHDVLMALFYEAGKKPYNENVMNPDFKNQNAETMSEIFMTILGKTKEEISVDYVAWLNENY